MQTHPAKPVFNSSGATALLNVLGAAVQIKISGRDTAGAFSQAEVTVAADDGVPPHIHHCEEETFYILEGNFEIVCGDQRHKLSKGATAHLPRMIPHHFRNVGNSTGKVLVTISPAGFEKFFEEVSALSVEQQQDIPGIVAIGKKYQMEILPPPNAQLI